MHVKTLCCLLCSLSALTQSESVLTNIAFEKLEGNLIKNTLNIYSVAELFEILIYCLPSSVIKFT